MEQTLQNFKDFLIGNGKSKSSVDNCLPHVRHFLKSKNVSDSSTVTNQMVTEYFAEIQPKCSLPKWNQSIWALRVFLVDWSKVSGIEFPKQKRPLKKIRRPITEDELENVLYPVIVMTFPNALQVIAILYFLFYTNIHKNEIVGVQRSDFARKDNELILIVSRQNIRREVPIGEVLENILKQYFGTQADKTNAFNTSIGKLNRIFAKLNAHEALGKDRPIGAQMFRDGHKQRNSLGQSKNKKNNS